MLLSIIKNVSKVTTIVFVAKTGYKVYTHGKTAYNTYKNIKKVKDLTSNNKGIQKVVSIFKNANEK